MFRDPRIAKILLLLFLGTKRISAYVPLTLTGFHQFRITRTHSDLRSSCIGNSNTCRRAWRQHQRHESSFGSRCCHNNFRVGLASSFSSDDDPADEFDSPSNRAGLEKDGSRLQQSSGKNDEDSDDTSIYRRMFDEIPFIHLFFVEGRKKLPPVQVDDFGVMLYDIFLIVNLDLSISFGVTHRLDFEFMPYAFNEGCLFSILWIAAGLYHGSFLYSAMDGHYPLDDEEGRGGPKAAAALAFNTYINAINLRLIAALVGAWIQHRKVGEGSPMEELIPLEIGCGLVLMTIWRTLHSQVTPRIR